ncbi:MAG: DUF1573 domain-containing protein [Bacteroidales bacterium]
MKRIVFVFSVLFIAIMTYAQPKVQMSKMEHDFGKFKEEAGRQTFNFDVTNNGDAPLVIQNIVASCGCTTPEWTRSPIASGGKGVITAIYDPVNRPGPFTKTLTVYTNGKPEMFVLTIKGEVIPHEKTIDELYTWPLGDIRFESNHLAFTNIKKTEKKIRVMPVINTSKEPVKIEFDITPPHLTLKANPETLKPGQKGLIEGTYDAKLNEGGWGNVNDLVRVKLNGVVQQNGFYYVSANLVEDFSGLSKEEIANAPVFRADATTKDIGTMAQETTRDVEFTFRNEGQRDLIIRHVRSSCGCTAVQQGTSNVIKPGEKGSIKATFNAGTYSGKVVKAIYVYSNDPKNSEVVFMLNADITPKAKQ